MKIQHLLIFLFTCIFVISGCAPKNSRAEFQKIASKVEMDYLDRANVGDFEMYLPKGYIEYKPDSKKYTKTTVMLPSGTEKNIICPYAQPDYKKNELDEFAELLDKTAISKSPPEFNDFLKHTKFFINYEKKSVLYVMPMCKSQIGLTAGMEAEIASMYNKSLDRFVNFSIYSVPYSGVSKTFLNVVVLEKYATVNPTIPIIATSSNAIILFLCFIFYFFLFCHK